MFMERITGLVLITVISRAVMAVYARTLSDTCTDTCFNVAYVELDLQNVGRP